MHKNIIGVVGRKLSGKGTFGALFSEICADKKVARMSFSDVLRDTLVAWGLPLTRHNLQRLAIIMNDEFGEGTLTHAVLLRVEKVDADIVILDGIRWPSDRNMLRQKPGFRMVYIMADSAVRYARRKAGQKAGEAEVSLQQFEEEDHVLTEQLIEEIGESADYVIENNGTETEFRERVHELFRKDS